MKKIFLLMTIMTSLFFALSIDSNASSSYNGITLDTTLTDLGGYSLREVFEDYNLLNVYNTYTDTDDYVYFNNNGANIGTLSGNVPQGFIDFNINNNVDLYLSFTIQAKQSNTITWRFLDDNGASFIYNDNFNAGDYKTFSYKHSGVTLSNGRFSFFMSNASTSTDSHVILNEAFLIELDYLGITLNTTMLDYYKSLYIAFKNDIDLELFFNAGSAVGYGNGLEDYHNGIYNYLDPTTGVPYNDGYNEGFIDGGVNGYENGYDIGYDDGYSDGVVEEVDTQWLLGFVTGTVNVLGVSIIPGISLGVFVFIPLFLGFIGFIFRLGGRRG